MGRGCCSRVCKEAKTSSGTDCEPRSKDAQWSPGRLNGFMNLSADQRCEDRQGAEAQPEKCHTATEDDTLVSSQPEARVSS